MATTERLPGSGDIRRSPLRLINTILLGLLLGGLVLVIVYPLIWMVLAGLKSSFELFSDPWGLPGELRFENYVKAWELGVVRYLLNSIIVTVGSIVGVVLISAWAAYGLSRLHLRFSTIALYFILGGMMLAPAVALIPLFRLLQALGVYDTYLAMILPYIAFRIPLTVFLIRAYLVTLPRELEDAAIVDGASYNQIFWRIIVPLSRPVLVSAALLQALFAWNEFPFALVFINDAGLKTLPVGLLDMQQLLTTDWPVLLAALTIAAMPMVLLFLVGQRHFIRGLGEGYGK